MLVTVYSSPDLYKIRGFRTNPTDNAMSGSGVTLYWAMPLAGHEYQSSMKRILAVHTTVIHAAGACISDPDLWMLKMAPMR